VASNPFLQGIAQAYPRLTPAERKVADVLLEDALRFSRSSMADIGTRAGASAPSIMRFCRAIGCAGLTELKQAVVASLSRHDTSVVFHLPAPRPPDDAAHILDYSDAVLRRLRGHLDSAQLTDAAALLTRATRITCVAAYQLGLAALYARDSLLRHGLAATAPALGELQRPARATGLFFCQGMPDAAMLDAITHHCRDGDGAIVLSDVPLASFVPASVRLVLGPAEAPAAGAGALLAHCLMTDILLARVDGDAAVKTAAAGASYASSGSIM
jgi:hypothetical protein